MAVRAATLASALLLCLAGTPARADPLRMVTIDTAPWASLDGPSGRPVGVFPDLVAELTRRTGLSFTMDLQPFARIPRELETRRQDCTILVWNEQWSAFMVRGETVSAHPIGVIARKGVRLRSYDDLRGLSISVLRGLSLGERFDTDVAILRQHDTDYLQGLNKLARGRLDAISGALPTIDHLARGGGLEHHLGDRLALGEMQLSFQCARGSAGMAAMPAVDAAIRAMVADGSVERVKAAWDYH